MVRSSPHTSRASNGSPHPRGDGPKTHATTKAKTAFSPPAWGWSERDSARIQADHVLPTRVGMVRRRLCGAGRNHSSPHPRGDGPNTNGSLGLSCSFSPPAWGWSAQLPPPTRAGVVLPTRVGMVRTAGLPIPGRDRSPHPRGDGPASVGVSYRRMVFSPPAWGWSVPDGQHSRQPGVLPTRVGMVRTSTPESWCAGSPHPRGDGPFRRLLRNDPGEFSPPAWGWSARNVYDHATRLFSPPAWGWSAKRRCQPAQRRVLPTRVGMVRARGKIAA